MKQHWDATIAAFKMPEREAVYVLGLREKQEKNL